MTLYLPKRSAIYRGNAFELLKRVEPGSVDLILTDPPYEVSQANNLTSMGRRGIDFGKWDYGFDQTGWLEDAHRTMSRNGAMVIFNDWKLLGFIAAHLQSLGMVVKRPIRWRKCLAGSTRIYARTQKGDAPAMLKDLVRLDPSTVELWTGSRWSKVVAWGRQDQPRSPVEIELRSGEVIRCTGDHRWPTTRGLLDAGSLVVGDVLQTTQLPEPGSPSRPTTLDDELVGWFVGLYIAEGSRGGHKKKPKIQISGHVDENIRHNRLQQLANDYHGSLAIHNVRGKAVSANLTGSVIHGIIDDYVAGRDCYDKHLTRKAWARSDAFLQAVLFGYLDGDGHYDEENDRFRLGFTGKNKQLANDLRTITARLGFNLRLRRRRASYGGKAFPAYKGEIRLSPSDRCKSDAEIVNIRPCRWAKEFWDVEVEDEPHLFALASGVLTHNSNPMPRNITRVPVQGDEYALWAVMPKSKWAFTVRPGISYERGEFEYPVVRGSEHPTKKPDELFEDIIKMFSYPGDTVLDPFAGSGTMACAAQRYKRKHISFEISKKYYELAVRSLEKVIDVQRHKGEGWYGTGV